jgi:ribonuclease E
MKRMLINATQAEEMRVALVDGQYLFNLFIENTANQQKKGNIYLGKVARIEPSLAAAFVDYGSERHGFLPFKDFAYTQPEGDEPVHIKDLLKPGQEIIIQVDKEERGNKGAAITNQISLAGSYLVLMPNNPNAGGISRRIESEDRGDLREILNSLVMPEGMGVIIRTAGVGRSLEELQWDLDVLLKQWASIIEASTGQPAPFLIYQESDVITRAMRDYLRPDITEIIVDEEKTFEELRGYLTKVRPDFADRVKFHQDKTPLFTRYQIEKQIESAFQREVQLPSGGALVIDITEALISIDINSARSTKAGDIEQTAYNTNLEAADEIARQLRLRDLGGLVVIDFIDMTPTANQRDVENRLRDAVQEDRARIQLGRISRFGLLEMSRQRLRPSLREANQITCPRCSGQGTIRNVASLALTILRLIEEEALKEPGSQIHIHVPVAVATFLLNEKRNQITMIERRYQSSLMILANPDLQTPHYAINRVRAQDVDRNSDMLSYEISHQFEEEIHNETQQRVEAEQPAVKMIQPDTAAPMPTQRKQTTRNAAPKKGFFARFFAALFGKEDTPVQPARRHHNNNNRGRQHTGERNNHTPRTPRAPRPEGARTENPRNEGTRNENAAPSETGATGQPRRNNNNRRRRYNNNRTGGQGAANAAPTNIEK